MSDELDVLRHDNDVIEPDPQFRAELMDQLRHAMASGLDLPPHALTLSRVASDMTEKDTPHQRRPSRWLAVAAVAACLLAVVAIAAVLVDDHRAVDSIDPAESPTPTTSEGGGPLDLDALAEAGEFRVNNVVVTIQCTATKSTPDSAMRDLVLGGVVTDNPDNLATLDGVSVAVGDLLALIIREDPDTVRRVTLYDNTQWFGGATISSCDELVESVPTWVDGGFFAGVGGDFDLEIGEPPTNDDGPPTLAKGEDVVIGGFGRLAGQTLSIDAVEKDGEVTGEFRVNNVVVTLQCADTDTIDGEIRLGGEVTDDPDGQDLAVIDYGGGDGNVAVGDLVALIIRERGPDFDMVSLYANDDAGSCTELVESVPYNLDGGFFNDVADGDAIETGGVEFNP